MNDEINSADSSAHPASVHTAVATDLTTIEKLDSEKLMHTYKRKPVAFDHGQGMHLYDTDGKEYLDLLSGLGTMGLGHSNKAVSDTLCDQSKKLMHVSNLYHVEGRGELASALIALYGQPGKVFFGNSGAEANECAIKLARKWGHANKPAADTIVTATGSFHGRTLATIAATGQPEFARPFAPITPGFAHTPFNDVEALDVMLGEKTIAFMIEVVQGESGVWPATKEYVQTAAELCKQRDILFIVDEVQSGIYRSGKPFAFQHFGIAPDIITSAKALGNGFPVGATIARTSVADAFSPGDHGTTFGGNVLACAVCLAVLDCYKAMDIEEHVTNVGAYARKRLAEIPGVCDVRGIGLMIGFTFSDFSAQECAEELLANGIVVNAIGDSYIRILPPLICEYAHIDTLVSAINAIIENKK